MPIKKKKAKKEVRWVSTKAFGRGGRTTLERYGPEHFSRIAKKAWAKRRRNAAKAKK
jgi:hypothetical protein